VAVRPLVVAIRPAPRVEASAHPPDGRRFGGAACRTRAVRTRRCFTVFPDDPPAAPNVFPTEDINGAPCGVLPENRAHAGPGLAHCRIARPHVDASTEHGCV